MTIGKSVARVAYLTHVHEKKRVKLAKRMRNVRNIQTGIHKHASTIGRLPPEIMMRRRNVLIRRRPAKAYAVAKSKRGVSQHALRLFEKHYQGELNTAVIDLVNRLR